MDGKVLAVVATDLEPARGLRMCMVRVPICPSAYMYKAYLYLRSLHPHDAELPVPLSGAAIEQPTEDLELVEARDCIAIAEERAQRREHLLRDHEPLPVQRLRLRVGGRQLAPVDLEEVVALQHLRVVLPLRVGPLEELVARGVVLRLWAVRVLLGGRG